jgi:hypothetical protein
MSDTANALMQPELQRQQLEQQHEYQMQEIQAQHDLQMRQLQEQRRLLVEQQQRLAADHQRVQKERQKQRVAAPTKQNREMGWKACGLSRDIPALNDCMRRWDAGHG